MIAPLVNLRGLLRGLHGHGVDYLISGAMAMVFYGYVRNTEDLVRNTGKLLFASGDPFSCV